MNGLHFTLVQALSTLKKRFTFVVLFSVIMGSFSLAYAQKASSSTRSLEQITQDAHDAFGRGEYLQAKKGYEALLKQNPTHQTAWYNLGTVEAHLSDFGRGAYALQQALILAPHDQDAQEQLKRINQVAIEDGMRRPGAKRLVLPDEISSQGGLLALISLKGTQIFSWLCGSLACVLLFLIRRSQRRFQRGEVQVEESKYNQSQAFLRVCFFGVATLAVLGGGIWKLKDLEVNQTRKGVIMGKRVPLYRGPGSQFESKVNIAGGVVVELQGKENEWQRVVLSDGQEGWIEEDQIGYLKRDL